MRGAVVTDVLESKPHASSSAQTIVAGKLATRNQMAEPLRKDQTPSPQRVHTKHTYATTPSPALSCASAKRNSERYASDHSSPKYDVKRPCAGSRSALNAS